MGMGLFVAGAATLMLGVELLVRGISRLAPALGLPARASALTLAALAAGSPELAVAVRASGGGLPDIALGSLIGSSIFNLLFLVGSVALAVPLFVADRLVRRQVAVMVGAALLFFVLGQDGAIARGEGITLLVLLAVHLVLLLGAARQVVIEDEVETEDGTAEERRGWRASDPALLLAGAGLLVIGSGWMVHGVVGIAELLGVSEQVIALTLIGSTTALPKITIALQAAIRGRPEIAVGAILGSSLFNILGGVGLASVGAPAGIEISRALLGFDLPVLLAAAAASIPLLRSRLPPAWEGACLVVGYLGYVLVRLWGEVHPEVLSPLGGATALFVILIAGPALAILLRRLRRAGSTRDLRRVLQPRRKHG
ncbi:MAG TPA: sodium:calcium antiporter [Longimicrobiaceae bacterium]|nr:sodium:calcium antiporter [Longimicrobiaceae bacterium]